MNYGVILASTPTTLTRALIIDGQVRVQRFTAPVEIALDRAAAEEVLTLAEAAEAASSDAYLAKLLRDEHAMPDNPVVHAVLVQQTLEHEERC